ncbi:MAG: hypothetical protein KIS63_23915, partial [Caldilineales bacterium]|nr:hypothetical protein [Caldilineales bacterium]
MTQLHPHPTNPVTTLYADDVARLHRAGRLTGPNVHCHGPILTLARKGALLTLLITDAGYL